MDTEHVLIESSEGEILIELFPGAVPKSVANSLRYVDEGHYEQTIFHRVVRGFVIQWRPQGSRPKFHKKLSWISILKECLDGNSLISSRENTPDS